LVDETTSADLLGVQNPSTEPYPQPVLSAAPRIGGYCD